MIAIVFLTWCENDRTECAQRGAGKKRGARSAERRTGNHSPFPGPRSQVPVPRSECFSVCSDSLLGVPAEFASDKLQFRQREQGARPTVGREVDDACVVNLHGPAVD